MLLSKHHKTHLAFLKPQNREGKTKKILKDSSANSKAKDVFYISEIILKAHCQINLLVKSDSCL